MVMQTLWIHLGAQLECLVGIGAGIARCLDGVTVLSNKMSRDEQHVRDDLLVNGQLCRLEAVVQHCNTNHSSARFAFERRCNLPYIATMLRQGAVHVARERLLNELCSQALSGKHSSAALVQELTLAILDVTARQQFHIDLAAASSCTFVEMAVAELTNQPAAAIDRRFNRAHFLFEARVSAHVVAQLDQLPLGYKHGNSGKAIEAVTQIHAKKLHEFAMAGYIAKKMGRRWRYRRDGGASSTSL